MSTIAGSTPASPHVAEHSQGWLDQASAARHDFMYTNQSSPLPEDEAEKVVGQLHEAMPGYNVRQYFAAQPTIFKDYAHLTVARNRATGTYVGLLGSRWFTGADLTYLYLWTAMIGAEARKTGLLTGMFLYQLAKVVQEKGPPLVIATKTYNPVVVKALQLIPTFLEGAKLYPDLTASQQDPHMVELAKCVTKQLCPSLTVRYEDAVVVGGQAVVGPDFFPEMPPSGDAVVDAHFKKHLSRKDQILLVVDLPPEARASLINLLQMARSFQFDFSSMVKAMQNE